MLFDLHLASSKTSEPMGKRRACAKDRLTSSEIYGDYVIGHKMLSGMSAHVSRKLSKEVSKTSNAEYKLSKNKGNA